MTQLTPGARAPDFKAQTFDARVVCTQDLIGKKTWLAFYRYGGCPLCLHHLFEVTERYQDLHLDTIQVGAVFESQRLQFGKLGSRKFPKFDLISDPSGSLYELFGVEKNAAAIFHPQVAWKFIQAMTKGFFQRAVDGSFSRVPAHFLLHEDLSVHTAFYGKNIADHIPWETVQNFMLAPAKAVPKKKTARA